MFFFSISQTTSYMAHIAPPRASSLSRCFSAALLRCSAALLPCCGCGLCSVDMVAPVGMSPPALLTVKTRVLLHSSPAALNIDPAAWATTKPRRRKGGGDGRSPYPAQIRVQACPDKTQARDSTTKYTSGSLVRRPQHRGLGRCCIRRAGASVDRL
eukprot:SAG11_NODE_2597_length_3183_cov_6.312905_2_plen_156_part_00